jgi:transcriptional regulator with XRE-family HTH domain
MDFVHVSNQLIVEEIGRRFEKARLNENTSQVQLAEKAGVTSRTISNLEKGKSSIGLNNIIAILRALNLLSQLDNFLPAPPIRAKRLLSKRNDQRQRASKVSVQKKAPAKQGNWVWAEDVNGD